MCHHRVMAAFDLVIQGGTVVDGSGAPGRRADVGVAGDRIVAIGDLSAVDGDEVELVLDAKDRVVAPGLIDPHGYSDGSVLLDGALASHLHQGFTTQLSRAPAGGQAVGFDPETIRDEATYEAPVRHPRGIEHVIVNGRPAVLSGSETGERPGRLLRGA